MQNGPVYDGHGISFLYLAVLSLIEVALQSGRSNLASSQLYG